MKPIAALAASEARSLEGIVFDLDGTLLDQGSLALSSYAALHHLAEAGLSLVLCTGRPAAWAEALVRQWPLALAVAENGAVAYEPHDGAVVRIDRHDAGNRGRQRARLLTVVERLREAHPDVPLADDNLGRLSDITFDIGERAPVAAERIAAMRRDAHRAGARTFVSSIHLHVTLDGDDKASGTLYALRRARGLDAGRALARHAFVGDSANDAACFAAFRHTFAVANVRPHLAALSRTPGFVSPSPGGAGFVEIAERILELRR
jgi:HAD superfamily hydrolase (TIGR01484 family)